jgi:hypothetical protein
MPSTRRTPKKLPHWRTYSVIEPRPGNYLSIDEAARAAGDVPKKQIRNWIDARVVNFDADAARGEVMGRVPHRRFSELDVIRIALVERLNAFGFKTEESSDAVERIFRNICDEWELRYYPPNERENARIVDGLTATAVFIPIGPRMPTVQGRGVHMERKKDIMVVDVAKMKKLNPANEGAMLILFTAEIVRDVYKRLNEIQRED